MSRNRSKSDLSNDVLLHGKVDTGQMSTARNADEMLDFKNIQVITKETDLTTPREIHKIILP